MKTLARISHRTPSTILAAFVGSSALAMTFMVAAQVSLEVPLHNLHVAWTLTRVLIQL